MESKIPEKLRKWFPEGLSVSKRQLFLLLLAGILLLVVVIPVPDPDRDAGIAADPGENNLPSQEQYEEYADKLEKRTENLLRSVDGAGEVDVMITLKSTGRKVVEKDQSSESSRVTEEDSVGGSRTTEEAASDKTSIYVQGENGTQSPYIREELYPEVEGIVVVAQGGDNAVVAKNIAEAVQALFGVEAHKIKVMKRADT